MTHEEKGTAMEAVLQPVFERGFDGIGEVLSAVLNFAMLVEREKALGAQPYGRTAERGGHANGFKPRTLRTRVGELSLRVPQVRGAETPFYPSVLERGQRHERALVLALAEMYVQGIATRRVTEVLETMCGCGVSSEQVSRASSLLDAELEKWRTRPLGCVRALVLDALYEKVRMDGAVVSRAVLVATGVLADGRRTVLGVSAAVSEAEIHWRGFLRGLVDRGMHGVRFAVSDAHPGLKASLRAVLPGAAWQRCQCHLQRDAQAHVTKHDLKSQVAADIRAVFNAPSPEEARRLLDAAVEKYAKTQSKLAAWMEENIPEGLAVFRLPEPMRRRLRTGNMAENLNRQIRRRTRVAGLFPGEDSLLRLVSAVLSETSEEWETGKIYLSTEGMPA
jgi:transposase-like protein